MAMSTASHEQAKYEKPWQHEINFRSRLFLLFHSPAIPST
jgi:hypothetical protein